MSEIRKITIRFCNAAAFIGGIVCVAQPPETIKAAAITGRLPSSFADVAKMVEPAVVSIDTKGNFPDITVKEGTGPGTLTICRIFSARIRGVQATGSAAGLSSRKAAIS